MRLSRSRGPATSSGSASWESSVPCGPTGAAPSTPTESVPLPSASVSAQIETARHQWEEGHRRLQAAAADPIRYARLSAQVEALAEELRRRLGQVFTLRELADE